MARLIVDLVLFGAAVVAANPSSCGGGACEVGDHSLLQLASTATSLGSGKKAPVMATTAPVQIVANPERTVLNITGSIDLALSDLELMSKLLTYGQHKLCASETKGSNRIATLMQMMKVQSLLQEKAVERKADKGAGGDSDRSSANDGNSDPRPTWPLADFPDETVAMTESFEKISSDVNAEVRFVQKLMDAIAAQKDKNEVKASDIMERVHSLNSLLTMETQECTANGQFETPSDPPSAEEPSAPVPVSAAEGDEHAVDAKTKTKQADEQAAKADQQTSAKKADQNTTALVADGEEKGAEASDEEIEDVDADPQTPAEDKKQVGEKVEDVDADLQTTAEETKKTEAQKEPQPTPPPPSLLAEGDSTDAGPLVLLAERTVQHPEAESFSEAQKEDLVMKMMIPPELAVGRNLSLKVIFDKMENDTKSLEKDVAVLVERKNRLGVADDTNGDRLQHMDKDLGLEAGDKVSGALVALQTGRARSEPKVESTEMLKAKLLEEEEKESERAKLRDDIRQKMLPEATRAKITPISSNTVENVTESIDLEVNALEQDLDAITRRKHMVCVAASKFFDRFTEVINVLKTVEC